MAFERIPFTWDYNFFKYIFANKTDGLNKPNELSLAEAVAVSLDYFFDDFIEENGMDRVVLIICAFLYEIEHGEADSELAHAVKWHIEDFEAGGYDDLFTLESLDLLYKDIATIKAYLSKHPELLKD